MVKNWDCVDWIYFDKVTQDDKVMKSMSYKPINGAKKEGERIMQKENRMGRDMFVL